METRDKCRHLAGLCALLESRSPRAARTSFVQRAACSFCLLPASSSGNTGRILVETSSLLLLQVVVWRRQCWTILHILLSTSFSNRPSGSLGLEERARTPPQRPARQPAVRTLCGRAVLLHRQGVQLHDPSSSILSSSIVPFGSHPRPSIAFDWGFHLVISTSARVSISASFDLPR